MVGSDTFSGTLARAAGENVGTYAINQGTVANSNYAITYVADNYTINQKALTVTATSQSSTYGTALVLGSTAFTTSGLVANTGDAVNNVSLLFNGLNAVPATNNAGTYTNGIVASGATGSGLSNYSITYMPADLVMNKATLTVTPNAQSKTYGDANPVLTQVITGYVNGENLASSGVAGTVYATTAVTDDTAVGTHPLLGNSTGYTAANYDFTTANNTIVISRRGITVTADDTSRIYGSANPSFTYTVASDTGAAASRGLHGTDALTGLPTTAAVASTSVGTAAITQGGVINANNSNYDITFVNGTMTINKARLSLVGEKVYNGQIEFEAAQATSLSLQGVTINGVTETFNVSGNATMQSKNVQFALNSSTVISKPLADVNGFVLANQGNGLLSNYEPLAIADTSVTVTKRPVVLTAPVLNKTYDGGYTYNMTTTDLANMSTQLVGGDRVSAATVGFTTKDVGLNKQVTLSAVTINDGNNGLNYNYALTSSTSSQISPAPLTITAVSEAKFVTKADPVFTVVYSGLVNGETSSVVTQGAVHSSAACAQTGCVDTPAGAYALNPTGFASANYSITYVAGSYTVVPAQTLLVRVTPTVVNYGATPSYTMTAQYMSAGNVVNNLTPLDNGLITINDGAGSTASFAIAAASPVYSSAGKLVVGGYNLTAANKTVIGANFGNMVLVGSLNVTPKVIDVSTWTSGISTISKVYDGGTNINGFNLNVNNSVSGILANDLVNVSATGSYTDKNVGQNKAVNIDISLLGNDAANYVLRVDSSGAPVRRISGNYGTITQLGSVTWVGPTSGGRWSNASNWAGGALPDLNNVAQVLIPTGVNVLFDSALVGQVNSNVVNSGTITFNGVNNFDFNSNVSGTGNIVQSGLGVITISGNNTLTGSIDVNNASLVLGSLNATGIGTVISNGGTLLATATLAQLTTSGAITLGSNIHTVGNQTYNGPVTLKLANTSLISDAANITFNDTLDAGAGSYAITKSLAITANNGLVTFNGDVGNAMAATAYNSYATYQANSKNIYRLDVNARNIALNADVTTFENQSYTGAITVGDNGKTGVDNNGLIRTLISTDPSITFDGTVDDTTANTHTLIVKAIAPPNSNQMPIIDFKSDVGVTKQLAELKATVGVQDPAALIAVIDPNPNHFVGAINVAGNISTMRDQIYTADVVNVSNSITLASRQGNLVFNLGTDPAAGIVGTGNNVLGLKTSRTGAVTGAGTYRSLSMGESKFVEPVTTDYMGVIRNMISIAEIATPREVKGQARVEVGESMLIQGNRILDFEEGIDETKFKKQKADCASTANEDCAAGR